MVPTDPAYRRTVGEVLARYELEPSLRDVFVEGPTDRVIIRAALLELGHTSIGVYEIDTVDVPAHLLEAMDLQVGSRSRVIGLAAQLEVRATKDLIRQVVCLVDTDFDEVLGRKRMLRLLVYTNGTALDTFLLDDLTLGKLLGIVLLDFPLSAAELKLRIIPILRELFLHRMAASELGLHVAPPSLDKDFHFDRKHKTMTFDAKAYVDRFLSKAGARRRRDEFIALVDDFRGRLGVDPITHVHVDDLLEIVHFCARATKPRVVPGLAQFRRFMYGVVDTFSIAQLPEVKEIVGRLT